MFSASNSIICRISSMTAVRIDGICSVCWICIAQVSLVWGQWVVVCSESGPIVGATASPIEACCRGVSVSVVGRMVMGC